MDDDESIRDLMRSMLEERPYEIIDAGNGHEALRQAAKDPPPDLVILDWMLPLLDGSEVWRELRKDPRTARTPILVVTAFAGELQNMPPNQVLHAILKPFPLLLFIEQVRLLSGA